MAKGASGQPLRPSRHSGGHVFRLPPWQLDIALPLTFADDSDGDHVTVGDTWRIEGAREAVEDGV